MYQPSLPTPQFLLLLNTTRLAENELACQLKLAIPKAMLSDNKQMEMMERANFGTNLRIQVLGRTHTRRKGANDGIQSWIY